MTKATEALLEVRNSLQKQLEDAQEVRACGAKPTAEEALSWAISDVNSRLRRLILTEVPGERPDTCGPGPEVGQ